MGQVRRAYSSPGRIPQYAAASALRQAHIRKRVVGDQPVAFRVAEHRPDSGVLRSVLDRPFASVDPRHVAQPTATVAGDEPRDPLSVVQFVAARPSVQVAHRSA